MAQYDAEGNKLVQIWILDETRNIINQDKAKGQTVGEYVKVLVEAKKESESYFTK